MNYSVSGSDLHNFCAKCDAICQSKLILADRKISNLLKTIAGSQDFCRFLEKCLTGYNYKAEFLKARSPHKEKEGKFVLRLPKGESLVAFVFCLLCEFENKERDLTEFLIEYYGFDDLFGDGYANFCREVIMPFKDAVLKLCSPAEDDSLVKAEVELAPDTLEISREHFLQINKLYRELARNINKEGRLDSEQRKDYLKVADTFLAACERGDRALVEALLLSLKYMCAGYKFLNAKVRLLEKIFCEVFASQDEQ